MKSEAPDEAYLLQAYSAGDESAFGVLYDRYDRQCFHFIRRLLGSADISGANDLHQETWETVAARATSFHPEKGSFCTWLLTIARNKVYDHFRKQKITFLVSAEPDFDAVLEIADSAPTTVDLVESRQMGLAIVKAVEALPLVQREVFLLFADGGLSLEEIAGATKVGVETAKSRLRYARASLRESLAHWRSVDA